MALLQKMHLAVAARGELVLLQVGSEAFSLEFQPALELSCAMRMEAAIAKRIAGDDTSRKNVFGVLSDANQERTVVSRFRRALPERLAARDMKVRHVGVTVQVYFGRRVMTLGYKDAMQVAQWLRVRAKEARNAARERAHWSELADGLSMAAV
jgi:hypothetical protein